MMRILQVIPNLSQGGAEHVVENLTLSLVALHHSVTVVSYFTYHTAITDVLKQHGIEVIYLDKHPGLDISIFHKLRKIITARRPDVIHSHLETSLYLPLVIPRHLPWIRTVHTRADRDISSRLRPLYTYLHRTERIIPVALTSTMQQDIAQFYQIPEAKIPVIPNGVDFSHFTFKQRAPKHDTDIHILNVGRNEPVKQQLTLIRAFARLQKIYPNISLTIVGDGSLHTALQQEVATHHIPNVHIAESTADVKPYYDSADLHVCSSFVEGMPLVLLEAGASGIPIVSTSVGGIHNMLDEQDAVWCEPNENSIVEALQYACEHYASLCERTQSVRNRLQHYDTSAMVARYEHLYQQAITQYDAMR